MKKVAKESELASLFDPSCDLVFVFKHSTRCPVSQMAFSEFQRFVSKRPHIAAYLIDVIDARAISLLFSERSGVQHASPQLVALKKGKVFWSASHGEIDREALESLL